ncbi:2-phospho-L-lactate guanylyltransferase [Micromonospora sp. RL09-050-HVF-A]|uniref:2-phospho-L-lactate guanylyltransferase n=1 Tax=Micromonospora sp. RL09-050-HVF-A TaxID=1703433 RepID=UPI001C6043F6|nr:2-phospho-L-lactate guanylyltransferase [Micromonospora sp. RL09-050-HVF-A]MBW4705320.1 2-phospho-L-lactate guanylyltransferase [Micromonospora sp. RL09-050-HVF-A]
MGQARWVVVVPVKRLRAAKSRLRGALPVVPHEELALALTADTVGAALACPAVAEVLVVTADPQVAAAVGAAGARVVPDRPDSGLNAALRHGVEVAVTDGDDTAGGGCGTWVAALTADLPALRPAELAAALHAVGTGPAGVRRFVSDAPGTGTTLLVAPPGVPLDPRFGVDSAAAHLASGAVPLPGGWPSLRRDVDTAADLADAARLGLGPATGALTGVVPAGPAEPAGGPGPTTHPGDTTGVRC